jgi:hypothetical protein
MIRTATMRQLRTFFDEFLHRQTLSACHHRLVAILAKLPKPARLILLNALIPNPPTTEVSKIKPAETS